MRLNELMTTKVVTIPAAAAAEDAWSLMWRRRIRHLVVVDGSEVVGIVSQRDLGGRAGDELRAGRTVRDMMSERLVTAPDSMTLRQAANVMRSRMIGALPVVDEDEKLMGIVTATDVLDQLGRGYTRPDVGGRSPRRAPVRVPPSRTQRGRPRSPRPRSMKQRAGGPDEADQIPTFIRAEGVRLPDRERDRLRQSLQTKLGKFAPTVQRISVRLADVNGPRGGVDRQCRIKVVLRGLPSVMVEHQDASQPAAIRRSVGAVERSVRKAVQSRRTKLRRVA